MGILCSAGPKIGRLPGRQAIALAICSLALLGGLALCPAPAGAQTIDGWLVGYPFECCPAVSGQQQQQFLALAYVPHIPDPESGSKIVYFKFQVFGSWRALVLANSQDRDNMQKAILGRPYASGSRELLDFQRAVAAPANGVWTEETWRAVYDYFKNLKAPQTKTIGSRSIRFAPLLKGRLDASMQQALKEAVENIIVGRNQIPFSALEPFLSWENQPPPSLPPLQTGQQTAEKNASSSLPGQAPFIDGWLLGYRFECCPGRGSVLGQYLSLGLFAHPVEESTGSAGVFVKYLVAGNEVTLGHNSQPMAAMRDAILGEPYIRGSSIVRDFQKAVGASADGVWDNETWLALFAYFDGLANPRTLVWQNRRIRFLPLHQTQLSTGQRTLLNVWLKNDNLSQNKMDLTVFRPLLTVDKAASGSGIYELSSAAVELVNSLDKKSREAARQAFELLAPERQIALADAARSLKNPQQYRLLDSSKPLVEAAGENAWTVSQALAALTPDQQAAIAKLVQQANSSASAQSAIDRSRALQKMLLEEQAKHKDLVDRLKTVPEDLKARLKEAGINPDRAFDSAKRQGLSYEIAQAWNKIEDRERRIVKPLNITGWLTLLILALVLKGLCKERAARTAKNRAGLAGWFRKRKR